MVEKKPIIEAVGISKHFGGVQALKNAKITCYPGEVHALVGENGAGKSTMIKILCGVVIPDEGQIYCQGKEIKMKNPIDARKHSIASVFQELSLLPDLSVAENIFLGCEPKTKLGFMDKKKMIRESLRIMEELEFDIDVRTLVKNLPLASQQLVEIAKALSKDPDVIILDEATSALGSREVGQLFKLVRRLTKEENKAVILISHKMDELDQIADRATIYRDACYITDFKWGAMSDAEIIDQIAGRKISSVYPPKSETVSDEIAFSIENGSYKNKLHDINLSVHKGEIFGLAGLSGMGQVDFLRVLYGVKKLEKGTITIQGKKTSIGKPRKGLMLGIGLTPADRKNDGLLLTRQSGENIALTTLAARSTLGVINRKQEKEAIQSIIDLLQIKLSDPSQEAGTLSGGNQQKLVLGKTILTNAEILLLSDPTRGIDVGTKFEIYQLVRDLADSGKTIILYSTENMELLGLCDRIAVFRDGRIASVLDKETMSEREVLKASLGLEDDRKGGVEDNEKI